MSKKNIFFDFFTNGSEKRHDLPTVFARFSDGSSTVLWKKCTHEKLLALLGLSCKWVHFSLCSFLKIKLIINKSAISCYSYSRQLAPERGVIREWFDFFSYRTTFCGTSNRTGWSLARWLADSLASCSTHTFVVAANEKKPTLFAVGLAFVLFARFDFLSHFNNNPPVTKVQLNNKKAPRYLGTLHNAY